MTNTNILFSPKLKVLIDEKQNEGLRLCNLDFNYSKCEYHVSFYRKSDNSYIVWTTDFFENNEKDSYNCFYNGKYDLTSSEAEAEIKRRIDR